MYNNKLTVEKRYNFENLLVLMCLFLYTSSQVYYYSDIRVSLPFFYQLTIIFRIFSLVILTFLTLNRIKNLKNLLKYSCVLLLTIFIFVFTKNHEFYFILLFILLYSIQNVEMIDILRCMNWAIIISTIIVVALSLLNIIDNNILIRKTGNSEFLRSSLGFSHPNVFGFMLLEIFINFSLIEKGIKSKFITIKTALITILCIVTINYFSDSRTSTIVIIGLSVFMFLIDKSFFNKRTIYTLSNFSILFSLAFTYYFSINYSYTNIMHITLNRLFSNRLMFLYQFYNRYGFKFWGQEVQMSTSRVGNNYFFLDSGFGRIFIEFGVLFGIIFIGLLLYNNYLGYKNELVVVNVFTVYVSVYSIIQDRLVVEPGWIIPAFYVLIKYSNLFFEKKDRDLSSEDLC